MATRLSDLEHPDPRFQKCERCGAWYGPTNKQHGENCKW